MKWCSAFPEQPFAPLENLVVWSATESEVEAMARAFREGLKRHALISELLDRVRLRRRLSMTMRLSAL